MPDQILRAREILTSIAAGAAGRASGLTRAARGVTALLASLVGVDLTLGKLTGADALVGGAVLLETAVLCDCVSYNLLKDGEQKRRSVYQWACRFQTY